MEIRLNSISAAIALGVFSASASVAAPLPFKDDFSDGDMSGWTVVEQGATAGPAVWQVSDSEAVQSSGIYTDSDPLQPGTFAWTGDSSWTDYYAKVRIRSAGTGAIGLMFRYQDEDNYYRFSMDAGDETARLVRVAAGAAAILDEAAFAYARDTNHQVEVVASGNALEAFVDGARLLAATDASFAAGGIALYSHRNAGSAFTNVVAAAAADDADGDGAADLDDPDDDNDGFNDFLEGIAGTDPLSAASAPSSVSVSFGAGTAPRPDPFGAAGPVPYTDARGYGWRGLFSSTRVAAGLSRPLFVTHAPGDYSRVFIVEQFSGSTGRVRILDLDTGQLRPTPFLSVSPVATGGEQGLLGLAFHPDYSNNGFFYVNYTHASGATVVARYRVSGDPDVADPGSAETVLSIAQPYTNHNGGWLSFGPDGYLYVALGDGGSGGDPGNRAQNLNDLLGKILRLDVDGDDFPADPDRNYAVPPSNPFVGAAGLDEIWAYGFRNPWRSSFDRLTGDLWIADVGQGAAEEVNFQPFGSPGGENYGWRCYEGGSPYNTSGCAPAGTMEFPIHEYGHTGGACSVTGGCVYRGGALPDLGGAYFFADFCTANIWSFRYDGVRALEFSDRTAELAPGGGLAIDLVSSFGEDAEGELYICDLGGEVFKIVPREE